MRSFKSSEHINEERDGTYRGYTIITMILSNMTFYALTQELNVLNVLPPTLAQPGRFIMTCNILFDLRLRPV